MHVGDLDGVVTEQNKNKWDATVSVSVFDATGAPAPDVTVSGTWSGADTGAASCTTDASGTCSLAVEGIHKGEASVTFTVDGAAHPSLVYQPADNADPDGDSDGTRITVYKP
jgi:hypothetical protein